MCCTFMVLSAVPSLSQVCMCHKWRAWLPTVTLCTCSGRQWTTPLSTSWSSRRTTRTQSLWCKRWRGRTTRRPASSTTPHTASEWQPKTSPSRAATPSLSAETPSKKNPTKPNWTEQNVANSHPTRKRRGKCKKKGSNLYYKALLNDLFGKMFNIFDQMWEVTFSLKIFSLKKRAHR